MKILSLFFIFVLMFVLIALPLCSAVQFEMKSNFSKGETLIAKISGNFVEPISKENIFFYRRHMPTSINSYLTKIDGDFYIYALLPTEKIPDNYSIQIKNVKYLIGTQTSTQTLIKNFSINENIADFSINPGFIVTSGNFFIEAQNLKDYEINLQINTETITENTGGFFSSLFEKGDSTDSDISETLKSGEIKKIYFDFNDLNQSCFKKIQISSENTNYEIPVYVLVENNPFVEKRNLEFEPSLINITLPTNENHTKIIYLFNYNNYSFENINFSVSDSIKPYVSLSSNNLDELNENSSYKLEINFFSDKEIDLQGEIKAKTNENSESLLIFLKVIPDYEPLPSNITPVNFSETCAEKNGTICKKDEKCDIKEIEAKDDKCCLGNCEKIEKSSIGKMVGWLIIIIIFIFLLWFFIIKYRGTKNSFSFQSILNKK